MYICNNAYKSLYNVHFVNQTLKKGKTKKRLDHLKFTYFGLGNVPCRTSHPYSLIVNSPRVKDTTKRDMVSGWI